MHYPHDIIHLHFARCTPPSKQNASISTITAHAPAKQRTAKVRMQRNPPPCTHPTIGATNNPAIRDLHGLFAN